MKYEKFLYILVIIIMVVVAFFIITKKLPTPKKTEPTEIYFVKSSMEHWCNWITRCPVKAETYTACRGSNPLCSAKEKRKVIDDYFKNVSRTASNAGLQS